MIRVRAPWLLFAAAVIVTGCAQQDAATAETAEVSEKKQEDLVKAEAATDEIEAAFIAAYSAEDGAGIAALFAPDGTIAPPELMSIEQPSIADFYNAQFASGADFTLEVEREDMVVAGKTTVAWGGFATSVIVEGAEPIVTTGRYGVVSRLQADGTWKIYRHMFNYITPPPEM